MKRLVFPYLIGLAALLPGEIIAQEGDGEPVSTSDRIQLGEILVAGRSETLLNEAYSAAEGRVGQEQLSERPIVRPAEVLEAIPGLVASQHSGSGKANQYYLRGFNLDHGTDFLTSFEGMPINLPTHAHGQGYTDLNFLIPELIDSMEYRKGPYYADKGDFSSAGSADIHLFNSLPNSIVSVSGGSYEYARALAAGSPTLGDGHLLYGLETQHDNGPWERNENLGKFNGVLRYSEGTSHSEFSLTGLAYHSEWDSTDQIPRRAIDAGEISRLGRIDPTDGGRTSRYSAIADWQDQSGSTLTHLNLYAYYYRLNLYSNFTYFLDDPVNGDQFEQADRRTGTGGSAQRTWGGSLFGKDLSTTLGTQFRNDSIPQVALYHTRARSRIDTTRNDAVTETSGALFFNTDVVWLEKLRTSTGVRGDLYYFDVDSSTEENSGSEWDNIVSPKFSAVLGPWSETEFYLNAGTGFHSNDARGTTITVDPTDPTTAADKVNPLVRSKGAEIGVRTAAVPDLVSTFSLWLLDLESELLFVGDAGTTEPTRPSRRYGIELANYYKLSPTTSFDADLSLSHANFTNSSPEGDDIPGSIESVFASGLAYDPGNGPFADVRLRYFGPRPLTENDSIRSNSTTTTNLRAGYHFGDYGEFKKVSLWLDVLNVFDSNDSDIDYYYTSRLPGEPSAGVDDIHTHPIQPRTFRVTFVVGF